MASVKRCVRKRRNPLKKMGASLLKWRFYDCCRYTRNAYFRNKKISVAIYVASVPDGFWRVVHLNVLLRTNFSEIPVNIRPETQRYRGYPIQAGPASSPGNMFGAGRTTSGAPPPLRLGLRLTAMGWQRVRGRGDSPASKKPGRPSPLPRFCYARTELSL